MKKILVIGCNSFSGSNFVNFLLNKNYKVYGISRSSNYKNIYLKYKFNTKLKNFSFLRLNLNKKKDFDKITNLVKNLKISYIANFAAQGMVNESWEKPIDWYQTNVISSIKLVENLKRFKFIKKFLQVSTPEVFGNTNKTLYENSKFEPSTPYAVSRAAFDFHLINLQKNFGFPAVISRAANVYGPGQPLYRIIPKIFIFIKKNKKISLDGNGKTLRSFVYIDDVVKAYYIILKKGKVGQSYIVSDNKFLTIKQLSQKILSLKKKKFNKHIVLKSNDRIGKDLRYRISNKKIISEFKFKFKTNINSGLKLVDKWIENNLSGLMKEKTNYKHKK